jgi:hypothetical protein
VLVWIGLDVALRSESHDGVHLQGRMRLAPGQTIEIARGESRRGPVIRRATVRSWQVRALGSGGPVYHGFCAWQ